jgi:uncharacterized damage-inducible protein DinB
MLKEILLDIYHRDLNKLKEEISAYPDEAAIWEIRDAAPNSAGNLCLHLNGNLQHFLGAVLEGTGYVRDRDAEFSTKFVPRATMLTDVDRTAEVVTSVLSNLTEDDLAKTYPIEVFGKPMTTGWFLTHLATHLTWHLGQINYHRRIS